MKLPIGFWNGWFVLTLGFLLFSSGSFAQYFGKNKVNYEEREFQTYRNEHFRIYHYLSEEVIERFGHWSNDWYDRHSLILKDSLREGNPMVIYADHPDFQQTTTINSMIGVGTGGVTEGARERVVMPLSASHAETYHVLGHELVHAFQYTMVKRGDSSNLNSIQNIPLWMVEGLAEYLSIGRKDQQTSMWLRSDLKNGELPSIKDLTRHPDQYFPYRYGHAFWAYVTGEYSDRAIRPLFMNAAEHGHRKAIKRTLGVSADSLSSMWKRSIRERYRGRIDTAGRSVPGKLLVGKEGDGEMNLAPSLSPDGDLMAFVSDKRVISMEYFIADGETGRVMDRISEGMRESHIDDLSFISSAPAWSPRGRRVALTTHAKGDNRLLIYDVQRGETLKHVKLPGLPAFRDPAWAPDGDHIVVSGQRNGKSDLYLYDIEDDELRQLTDDLYSDLHPTWAPDGKALLFVSDRGPLTSVKKGRFEGYSICRLDLESGELHRFELFPGAENLNPQYAPDGESFYFLSDRNGKRDLYSYELESGRVYQRTDLYTGIGGLTGLAPSFHVASESGEMLFNHYKGGDYRIFRVKPSELMKRELSPSSVDQSLAWLPQGGSDPGKSQVQKLLGEYPEEGGGKGEHKPYQPDFGLEYGGNASIGIGMDQMGTAMMGGVSFLFSDILKRDQLFTNLRVAGSLQDMGGAVSYLNRHHRIGWNLSFSHIPYRSYRSWYELVPYQGSLVERQVIELTRIYEDQLGLAAQYPISKNLRWELGANATRYGFSVDSINRYYDGSFFLGEEEYRDEAPDPFYQYDANIAFVGDASSFGLTSPLEGYRFRYQVGHTTGRFQYSSILADHRKYWFFGDFGLALRGIHQARYGSGANGLYPLYIGYDQFLRGYSGAAYDLRRCPTGECLDQGRLVGTRMALLNGELRVPLSGPERLSLIPSGTFYSDLVGFVDAGMAWNAGSDIAMNWDPKRGVRSPLVSSGVALRLNLYGIIVIEPYYAFPFQDPGNRSGTFGFYLSSGGW